MRISRKMALYAMKRGFVLFDGTVSPVINNCGSASTNWANYDGGSCAEPIYGDVSGYGYAITIKTNWVGVSSTGYKVNKVAVDVTNYTKCTVVYKSLSTNNPCSVGLVRNQTKQGSDVTWLVRHPTDGSTSNNERTAVLDLSSITGAVYFLCSIYGKNAINSMAIRRIIFE